MYSGKTLMIAAASLLAAADLAAAAHGNETVVTTTRVVSEYTTFCPEPTTFHFNGHKYEVTEATTLTITDCPCTIVEPCPEPTNPVKPTIPVNPPVVVTSKPAPPPTSAPAPPPVTSVQPPPPGPPVVTPTAPVIIGSGGIESMQVSLSFAAAAAAVAGYLAL